MPPLTATVDGLLGAGSGCEEMAPLAAGRCEIEPVTSWRGGELEAKGLESKRDEFSQPATATPTSARTATRGQARGRDGTTRRGMWLLTHTQHN